MSNESGKKNDMSRIKRSCRKKNDNVEDEKVVFIYENVCLNKRWSRLYDSKRKFAKRKIGFEIRNGFLSFIISQGLLCTH